MAGVFFKQSTKFNLILSGGGNIIIKKTKLKRNDMRPINTKTILYSLSIATILALVGCGNSGTTATSPAQVVGELPIAIAGEDTTVEEGTSVTLDASSSSDPDGTIVSYEWQTQSGEGIASIEPTLSLGSLAVGVYTATLLVTDNDGNTATDSIIITVIEKVTEEAEADKPVVVPVTNKVPVAQAGVDQNIVEGDTLHLDGSASSDSDGTIDKYEWYKSTNPNSTVLGKTYTITGLTTGTYTITLKVTDDDGATATDNMIATVTTPVVADCPDNTAYITHNGTNYCTVTSPHTDKVWLDRNLGATQVCTAFNDEACYGDYYQWGRNYDGHQVGTSGTTETLADNVTTVGNGDFIKVDFNSNDLASGDADHDGAIRKANWSKIDGTSVCPTGYRVPTKEELENETTGASSAVGNRDDAFNSFLKLPSAGYRDFNDGRLSGQGINGDLWSASFDRYGSGSLNFTSSEANWYDNNAPANSQAVRCLRD